MAFAAAAAAVAAANSNNAKGKCNTQKEKFSFFGERWRPLKSFYGVFKRGLISFFLKIIIQKFFIFGKSYFHTYDNSSWHYLV